MALPTRKAKPERSIQHRLARRRRVREFIGFDELPFAGREDPEPHLVAPLKHPPVERERRRKSDYRPNPSDSMAICAKSYSDKRLSIPKQSYRRAEQRERELMPRAGGPENRVTRCQADNAKQRCRR
jgi:hypothetical protein